MKMAKSILDCDCGKKKKVQSCNRKDKHTCFVHSECICGSKRLIVLRNKRDCNYDCTLYKLHRVVRLKERIK